MADLTLLVNTTDSALLAGSGALPGGAARAGEGAAAGVSGGTGFAAVLGQQWPPEAGVVDGSSLPAQTTVVGAEAMQNGESPPLSGKALPGLADPDREASAPLLAASLLSAVSQALPTTAGNSSAVGAVTLGGVAMDDTPLPGPVTRSLPVWPTGLAAQSGPSQTPGHPLGLGHAQGALNQGAMPTPQSNLIAQVAGMPVSAPPAQDSQAVAGAASTTMLGQPLSTAAQQALARAGAISGTAPGRRGQVSSSVSGDEVLHRFGGINTHMARTDAVQRMDGFTAALTAARHTAPAAELHRPLNVSLPTELTSTQPITPESGMSISGELPRPGITTGPAMAPSLALATPVGQPAWAGELGQRVTWLASKELREAQLQLHPRNLGVVDVRIAYGADQQLNISFSTTNPIARDALDATLPRLREMLEQQGLQLGDANISHESPTEREPQQSRDDGVNRSVHLAHSVGGASDGLSVTGAPPPQWLAEGMLDAYA